LGSGGGQLVLTKSFDMGMPRVLTSPGLFGSFPWVGPGAGYCAFLMTFYLKNEGRGERYSTLKKLVEEAL